MKIMYLNETQHHCMNPKTPQSHCNNNELLPKVMTFSFLATGHNSLMIYSIH